MTKIEPNRTLSPMTAKSLRVSSTDKVATANRPGNGSALSMPTHFDSQLLAAASRATQHSVKIAIRLLPAGLDQNVRKGTRAGACSALRGARQATATTSAARMHCAVISTPGPGRASRQFTTDHAPTAQISVHTTSRAASVAFADTPDGSGGSTPAKRIATN